MIVIEALNLLYAVVEVSEDLPVVDIKHKHSTESTPESQAVIRLIG